MQGVFAGYQAGKLQATKKLQIAQILWNTMKKLKKELRLQ